MVVRKAASKCDASRRRSVVAGQSSPSAPAIAMRTKWPLARRLVSLTSFDIYCEEMLSRLDEEPRTIAVLRMLGHTNREIAAMLGCTERKVEGKLALIRSIWETAGIDKPISFTFCFPSDVLRTSHV